MSSAQPHFAGDYGAEDKFEKLDTWLISAVDIKSGGVLAGPVPYFVERLQVGGPAQEKLIIRTTKNLGKGRGLHVELGFV